MLRVKTCNAKTIALELLRCSKFNDAILMKLADSLPPTLTEFRLWSGGSSVTVDGMNACLGKILGRPQLENLDLSANKIGDDGAKMIADALRVNHSLETLDLSRNKISADGKEYLSKLKKELKDATRGIYIIW